MPKVVITMPAYRSAATLERTVADIPAGFADEIVLVDDASPDDTVERARRLPVTVYVHRANQGYGGNQKTCYRIALRGGADVVVLLHPDYQYDPRAVPLLVAPILAGHADLTFGSRFAGTGDPLAGGMPFYRFVGNRLTTFAENVMLGSRFTDLHTGMRAYTRRCLLSLPFLGYSQGFAFDSELLIDALTLGQRVIEVPIPTRYTLESSSISIGRSVQYIGRTLEYCVRAVARRGRRGRRSVVAARGPIPQPPASGRAACAACGGPLNVRGGATACRRCGAVWVNVGTGSAGVPPGPSPAAWTARLAAYHLTGRRLLVCGTTGAPVRDAATLAGWSASDAPVPGAGVDAAILTDALEILEDPVAAVREAAAHLLPEGLMVVTLGRGVSRDPLAATPRHRLPPAAVRALLLAAGLRLVEWRDTGREGPIVAVARAG